MTVLLHLDEISVYPQIGSPGRELRTCVIKKLQERTPLSKGLDHLLGLLEKKDPQNFFAWPVTDNIAPGYSSIITNPMDFSTMRQKIEENQYSHLDVSLFHAGIDAIMFFYVFFLGVRG